MWKPVKMRRKLVPSTKMFRSSVATMAAAATGGLPPARYMRVREKCVKGIYRNPLLNFLTNSAKEMERNAQTMREAEV